MKSECVLVVDDEVLIADTMCWMLEDMGLTVCGTAVTADQAIELAAKHSPGLILMDVRLKGKKDGVEAAIAIYKLLECAVVFVTGSREPETIKRIQQDHPAGILFKPFLAHQLKAAIDNAKSP